MTAAASSADSSGAKPDPILVLVDAVEATIASVATALAPIAAGDLNNQNAATAAPAFDDVVADALGNYLERVRPVQLEITILRHEQGAGPLDTAMRHLGEAFTCFSHGANQQALSELRAAHESLAQMSAGRTAKAATEA